MRRIRRIAAAAFALGLIAAGCTGPKGPPANDAAGPVLVASSKTIGAGTSKVAMNGSIAAGGMSFGMTGEGAFDFKTQNGTMTVKLIGDEIPDAFSGFDLLFVDRTLYMKFPADFAQFLPGLKPWIKMDLDQFARQAGLPGFGSFTSQDPTSALRFLRAADDVTVAGRESVRGAATTHYRMVIDVGKAAEGLSKAERAGWSKLIEGTGLEQFPMEVWLDEQGRARRLHFSMEIADLGSIGGEAVKGQKGTMTFSTDLFDFGSAVTVAAPKPDQVSDYAEFAKLGGG